MDGPLNAPNDAESRGGGERPGPLVVKLGGALLDSPELFAATFDAIALLHQRHPGGVVAVHGGGKAVDRQLERLGLASERREGIRITPPEHLEQIVGVLAGAMNTRLVGLLTARGVPAVGLTLSDGLLCRVEKCGRYDFDPGCVGEVVGGHPTLVRHLVGGGFMPVLSSIGIDPAGQPLNVNADDAAASVAGLLRASALLVLTDVPGVLGPDGGLIPELGPEEAESLIASGVVTGGMVVKVRGAVSAAVHAGTPVVIASWSDPQAILSLARGAGAGTRIHPRSAVAA
ncbi:MAG: acetylglutamate kinase [Phycisphaerales bacterium]